jgi:hypothetical protein
VIEEAAYGTRKICGLEARSNFSLTELIRERLSSALGFEITVRHYPDGQELVPAYVGLTPNGGGKILHVENGVWERAERGFPKDRFILGHEIGHMVLHSHEELAYCESLPGTLSDLQDQEKAEYQANWYCDCFLAPRKMLLGFVDPEEVAEHFNIPLDCARRRLATIEDAKRRSGADATGEFCLRCMNFSLIRVNGAVVCNVC